MNPRARKPSPGVPSQLSPDLNPLFRAKPGGGAPAGPPHRVPDPEAEAPRLRLANPGSSLGPVSAVSCGGDVGFFHTSFQGKSDYGLFLNQDLLLGG